MPQNGSSIYGRFGTSLHIDLNEWPTQRYGGFHGSFNAQICYPGQHVSCDINIKPLKERINAESGNCLRGNPGEQRCSWSRKRGTLTAREGPGQGHDEVAQVVGVTDKPPPARRQQRLAGGGRNRAQIYGGRERERERERERNGRGAGRGQTEQRRRR